MEEEKVSEKKKKKKKSLASTVIIMIGMASSRSSEYDKLMLPLKRTCQVFGCWPYSVHRWHRAFVFVGLLLNVVCCSAELPLLLSRGDMNETIEASLVSSAFYMTLVRFVLFSLRRKEMLYILDVMRADWTSVRDNADDSKILARKTLGTFKLSKLFTLNTLFAGSAFAIMPALEQAILPADDRKAAVLPFGGYYFFNHTRSSSIYAATYVTNALLGGMGCSTIAGATCFSLITTVHASAKFALVRQHFESITASEWMQQSSRKFKLCVQEHQQCIKFAEAVEKTINVLALAQFVISTGLVCFAGFQLTTMLEDRARLTKYSSFLNAAIFELFIFSYSGQRLKSESEAVADFAYSSHWLGAYRKSIDIQMVIMRASKACTITAAKFYDMTLEAFLKVLSSSFSYFSVLAATQDN